MIDLSAMTTETRNKNTMRLDEMSSLEIVMAMNKEDATVPVAVSTVLEDIAAVVDWCVAALSDGGRII